MMKIVSTHRTLPTHHHPVCCMKADCQVSLPKILMKPMMDFILRQVWKSLQKTILKPCMI